MPEEKPTTVQVDQETSRKLGLLAEVYRRSKTQQVSFMIEAEYQRLVATGMLIDEKNLQTQAKA